MSSDNPFAPIFNETPPSSRELAGSGDITNVVPDFGEIFQNAWNTWKNNLGLVVGAAVLVLGISMVVSFLGGMFEGLMLENGKATLGSSIFNFLFAIANNLLSIFLGIGNVRLTLALLRGQPASVSMIFSGIDKLLPAFFVSLLFGLMIFGGLLLLIVPGVIVMFRFWPAYYLVVDRHVPVMKSFGLAYEITRGNSLNSFLIWICGTAIAFIGLLACFVGIVFAQPLVLLMVSAGYLMMSGQLGGPIQNRYSSN